MAHRHGRQPPRARYGGAGAGNPRAHAAHACLEAGSVSLHRGHPTLRDCTSGGPCGPWLDELRGQTATLTFVRLSIVDNFGVWARVRGPSSTVKARRAASDCQGGRTSRAGLEMVVSTRTALLTVVLNPGWPGPFQLLGAGTMARAKCSPREVDGSRAFDCIATLCLLMLVRDAIAAVAPPSSYQQGEWPPSCGIGFPKGRATDLLHASQSTGTEPSGKCDQR